MPVISTLTLQVKDKNQFANLGHNEKSFKRLSMLKKGPIMQATILAITPEGK
jgi:hypothetical protein|tara:strand:- start:162 stop:317 length:156 start_codon:yes stop_codon:yes gene_type:complete